MKFIVFLLSILCMEAYSQDSLVTVYHSNQIIKTKGLLVNEKKEGQWVEYYTDGQIAELTNWKNGLLDSVQLRYHRNGIIKERAYVKEGEFVGYITLYYDNGVRKGRTLYENGKAIPPYQFFDAEGNMIKSGPYKSGYVYYYDVTTGEVKDSLIPVSSSPLLGWDLKPVIYLYPQTTTEINVQLVYDGDLLITYPNYNKGWNVIAEPDGSLLNISDSSRHYYLFWEGENNNSFTESFNPLFGFVVRGEEAESFLVSKFQEMNLTSKEYNDFIVFWLPRMIKNEFNRIHFIFNEDYNIVSKMEITPNSDSIFRVYMVLEALKEPVFVQPQEIPRASREGFNVIEWGGTELPVLNK